MFTAAIAAAVLNSNAAQSKSEWPFKILPDAIVVDSEVNGRRVSCMFDTGFSGSYVLNQSVNVGKPTGTMSLKDFVGVFEAPTVKVTSLKMGEVKFDTEGKEVVQMPDEDYTLNYGTHCDGIMGLEVIAHRITTIDFQQSKFIFHPDSYDISQFKGQPGKIVLKMLPIGNNSIELQAKAPNGKKLNLALDTGNAFYSTTHKDSLERIGLWKTGVKPNYVKQSFVASGAVDSWDLELENMNIFGHDVPYSVWNIIDRPASDAEGDGTVGFGFLKNFIITVDMERRLVMLENFTGQVSTPKTGDVGFYAFFDPRSNRMVITRVLPGSPAERAGIKRGDYLVSIEGQEVQAMGFRALLRVLEGEPGSIIHVATSRDGVLNRHELKREPMLNKPILN
ncbi:MAG: PDZ domain-containing protein [Armatimonadetes bacterium]|nr:PDZ domain-containing protein [Armatimonadota bacterium]